MDNNPYDPRQINLNLFFGKDRLKAVKEICRDLTVYCESSAVVAGQRMGKTTLLNKIRAELSSKAGVRCFYVDAQSRPLLNSSNDAFVWLGSYAGAGNSGYEDFARSLKTKIVRDAACSKIVFLIDEFDAFGIYEWHRHFFDNLRALLANNQELRGHLAIVIAGARRLENLLLGGEGSPLGNILSWRYLHLFDEEDSGLLVDDPTNGSLPPEIRKLVWEKTGGQPYFIQFLMSKLYGNFPEPVIPKLERAENDLLEKHEGTFKLWWDKHLSENEQKVFLMLMEEGNLSKNDIKKRLPNVGVANALKILSYMGFIRSPKEGNYIPAGLIITKWVEENV